ncbi:MAG: caspase family protein, partial [Gammaproteobacteria bacterium]
IDPARDGAVQNKKVSSQDILSMAVSFESNTIALATEDQTIKLLSLPDMAPVKELKAGDDISHLKFINRGEQLIGADPKGVLHVFDVGSATEILKLISTETGWTVVDSTGRFDSSEAGMGNVSWEAAEQDIPIDSFSTHYYEPGVMATALAHEPFINKQPQVVQAGINLPPELNLNAPGASKTADQPFIIALDVVDAGGGIGAQRLYHNGKIVDESRVLDKVDSEIDGRLNRRIRYQVPPVPGRNQFKAVVANLMGIDSPARELAFDVSGEKTPSTLHVIAVGINQYKDQRLNLDYSVADAKSIAAILKTKKLMSFKNIHELGLFDQNATKQAIIGRLKESANYPKEDVLVVYLAGHGLAINGEWYFMPHETTLQETEHEYAEIGISAQEIRDLMAEINMQKILILVDACYSGAGLNAFRHLQNSQRHFGRALSKSVGIVILAATRQDQQAAELADLGHGLFTYVVSQGMEGAADIRPKNQIISAYEVADFSTSTIPEYSKKYLGASQEPSAFTMGSDFVLLGQ